MTRTIRIECEAKTTLPLDKLVPFQDKIKTLPREQYEKFRKVLIDQGIKFSKHVWLNKGKYHIIDGHQTVYVLTKMRDEEKWVVPNLPVTLVKAKSLREAKLAVLAGASQFGQFDEVALEKYLKTNKIDLDLALESFEFVGIDPEKLSKEMEKVAPLPTGKGGPNMKVSSDDVHQVQLYFDTISHKLFMEACEKLSEEYETENISDTVLRAVCEATKD